MPARFDSLVADARHSPVHCGDVVDPCRGERLESGGEQIHAIAAAIMRGTGGGGSGRTRARSEPEAAEGADADAEAAAGAPSPSAPTLGLPALLAEYDKSEQVHETVLRQLLTTAHVMYMNKGRAEQPRQAGS